MNYTYDKHLRKWVVLIGGDIVLKEFDSEAECVAYVEGDNKQ